jgi:hypothetical protein
VRAPDPPAGLARRRPRIEAEVSAYLRQRDLACKHCGYNLRGIAGNRCPECGATYMLVGNDPVDRRLSKGDSGALQAAAYVPGVNWLAISTVVGGLIATGGVIRVLVLLSKEEGERGVRVIGGCGLALRPILMGLGWSRHVRRRWQDGEESGPLGTLLVCLLSLAVVVVAYLLVVLP